MFDCILNQPLVILVLITFVLLNFFPPKRINSLYGYRTAKSMKNQNNWNFAQKYSSQLTIKFTTSLLVFQLAMCYFEVNSKIDIIIQLVLVSISFAIVIYKTESKLKTQTDKNSEK